MVCLTQRQRNNRSIHKQVGYNVKGSAIHLGSGLRRHGEGLTLHGMGLRLHGTGLTVHGGELDLVGSGLGDVLKKMIKKGFQVFLPGLTKESAKNTLRKGVKSTLINNVIPALKKEAVNQVNQRAPTFAAPLINKGIDALETRAISEVKERLSKYKNAEGSGQEPRALNDRQISKLKNAKENDEWIVMDRHSKDYYLPVSKQRSTNVTHSSGGAKRTPRNKPALKMLANGGALQKF